MIKIIFLLVISTQAYSGRFKNTENTLIDKYTDLEWEDNTADKFFRGRSRKGRSYCSNLSLNNQNDWRVPKIAELKSFYHNRNFFKATEKSHTYYSSEPEFTVKDRFWGGNVLVNLSLDFDNGETENVAAGGSIITRCVRGPIYTKYDNLLLSIERKKEYKKILTIEPNKKNFENFISKYKNSSEAKIITKKLHKIYDKTFENISSSNDIEIFEKYISEHPNSRKSKEAITKSLALIKNNSESYLIGLLNFISKFNSNRDVFSSTFPVIHEQLILNKNIDDYFLVIERLGKYKDQSKILSNELTRLIFDQIVEPERDIDGTKKFINEFESSSGDIIYEAYNLAIELENEKLGELYDKRSQEDSGYFSSINDEEKNKIAERIARQIYIEAVQAKESDDNITFAIQYYIVTNNELFNQTEASFNLFRDKEMKSFFKQEFNDLKDTNRKASSRLATKISELSKTFEESLNNLSSSLETEPESQEDIDRQNHKFLMQSYIFDKTFRTDDER